MPASYGAPAALPSPSDGLGNTTTTIEPQTPANPPSRVNHDRLRKLFGSGDDFYSVFGGEQAAPIRKQMEERGDGGGMRQRVANTAFLSDKLGLTPREIADRYDTIRTQYARQMFPDRLAADGTMDDGVFFTNASRLLQSEADEATKMGAWNASLFEAAIEGRDFDGAVESIRATGEVPSDKRRLDIANAWMAQRWEANRTIAAKLSPVIDQVADVFTAVRTKQGTGTDDFLRQRETMLDTVAGLAPEEQSIVWSMAGRRALQGSAQSDRGAVGKTFGALTSATDDLVSTALAGLYNTVDVTIGHTEAESRRFQRAEVDRTFSRIASGEIDPIKADSFAGQVALDFVRSVPMTLAALTPAGLAVDFFALKQNARENLESQGVRGQAAEAVASVQAIPQTALFFATSKMVFLGKTPKAFGTSIPATLATEYVGNLALNEVGHLTDAGIQQVAAQLSSAMPDVDWRKFGQDFKDRLPQSLALAIPGALIGTGVASFKNRPAGTKYLQDPAVLDELGFTPEAKAAVVASGENYPSTEQAFREGYETRTPPPAPEATTIIEPLGRRYLVAEGIGEPVAQFQVKRSGEERGVTMTAEQVAAEGLPLPAETLTEIATVRGLDGEGFRAWSKQQKGGFTTTAHHLGRQVRSRAEVNALLRGEADANAQLEEVAQRAKGGDFEAMNAAMLLSTKAQFFREAYEAALGVLSAGKRLRDIDPNYIPPITRNPDGTYRVQAVDGTPAVTAATPEGAAMVANEHTTAAAQQAATAAPEPRPEQDGRALPPRVTALNKESIAGLRSLFNMDALDVPTRERFIQVLDEAKRTEASRTATEIAHDLIATRRVSSAAEHAALALRSAELQNNYEQVASQIGDAYASGDTAQAEALRRTADGLLSELDTITEASDLTGTEIARALSIRRMRLNRDDYTLARLVQRATEGKRAALTPEQHQQLKAITDDLIEQQRIIAEQKNRLAEQDIEMARQKAETSVAEGRARRRAATSKDATARRAALKGEILRLGLRVNDITSVIGNNVELARLVAKIADTYIEEGVATLQELTNKLKADIPDLSDQDVFLAVGRLATKEAKKIEGEAKRRVKELRSQAALWAKINAALEGQREGGTPLNREQQNRLLRESLAQLRRQANRTTFDDGALKRIDAKIAEVQNHLARSTRPAPVPKPEGSEKLNAARQTLNELRQEMGALDTIAELERLVGEAEPKPAAEGKTTPSPEPGEQAKKLNALRERIAELRDEIDQVQVDPAAVNAERLSKLQRLAAEVEDQLEGGFRALPEQRPAGVADTDIVAAARKQLRELEHLMRTEDSVADLEEQIRTGDFKVSAPEQRILSNAKLEAALIKQRQLRRKVDEALEVMREKTTRERIVEGLLIPRTLIASADMSATLRQGLLLSASRPVTAARAFVSSFRAFLKENTADAIALAIENRPGAMEGIRSKLYLSELGGLPSAREENFIGRFAERIPGFGRLVRASNRSMVTTLNLLRVAAFDGFVRAHPEATAQQKTAYAQYVNAASGRGNVKWSPSTVKTLNAVFFAPRYAVSRFQALYSPFKNFNDPTVRNAILKDFGALLGTGMTVLSLAALGGADVTLDPSDSDFGKIVIDETRIDIWGGLQQPARLVAQAALLIPQRAELVELGKDIDLLDAGTRFLSYKLSPAVTVPLALASGENIIGQEQEIPETLVRSIVPLTLQEAWDVARETESAGAAVGAAAGGFLGLGVQQHDRK